MRWSWKLGELAGIGIYVHATFLLIVGWVALQYWLPERSVAAALAGVTFVLALFGCVVLHELGHALAARRYGIRTRDITLLPIGGVARLERVPEEPRAELFVAIAGPAVNLAIALVLWLWLGLTGLERLGEIGVASGQFLSNLLWTNLYLAGFNLLPAFPMDGGRVLRALLATRLSYPRATELAAYVGQGMALLFGFVGLTQQQPVLLFIALFVWIGASSESGMVQVRAVLGGMPVSRAMMTEFASLAPAEPLARAAALTLAGTQKDFPVLDESGRVIGVLRQNDLIAGLNGAGQGAPIADFMCRSVEDVDSHAMLSEVLSRLEGAECRTVPVTHAGALVGLLSLENLGEFLRIHGALSARPPAR